MQVCVCVCVCGGGGGDKEKGQEADKEGGKVGLIVYERDNEKPHLS